MLTTSSSACGDLVVRGVEGLTGVGVAHVRDLS